MEVSFGSSETKNDATRD